MSLADCIDSFATGTYVVKRPGPVSYVGGKAVDGPVTEFSVRAVVAPLGGKELLRLPEGDRSAERLLVLTKTQLSSLNANSQADVITIDGRDYEVSNVEPWTMYGFCKATVTRTGR